MNLTRDMYEHTQEKGLTSASIAISAFMILKFAAFTSGYTQERNHISASIVISALIIHHHARVMNVNTQERNLSVHASW